jgi:hypothetical protein
MSPSLPTRLSRALAEARPAVLRRRPPLLPGSVDPRATRAIALVALATALVAMA